MPSLLISVEVGDEVCEGVIRLRVRADAYPLRLLKGSERLGGEASHSNGMPPTCAIFAKYILMAVGMSSPLLARTESRQTSHNLMPEDAILFYFSQPFLHRETCACKANQREAKEVNHAGTRTASVRKFGARFVFDCQQRKTVTR